MTPDSPLPPIDRNRQQLVELRDHLAALHKALIGVERLSYERTFGSVTSQYHFLQLLLSDPWFAWLRPLSGLVASIDEALEPTNILTPTEANVLLDQARMLLKPSETGEGFGRSYFEALQQEPDVVLAHAAAVKCLRAA
jgi:hypothetical protein